MIKCGKAKWKKDVYTNTHAIIKTNKKVLEKINNTEENNKTLSVLLVGIDSISRLNLIRSLPKTHEFLKNNNWTELLGYNKVADNTFPNVMALLTGLNESLAYSICNPKQIGYLDKCKFLWHNYSDFNYITAYSEDEALINTFNYNKKGFVNPPVDYYFRPYFMASEKLKIVKKDGMSYCTGPETSGERVLNIAKDFAVTFKKNAKFGLFWMNTFSHNDINSVSGMDEKLRNFLNDIKNEGVLDNTMVVFFSDHGMRFGKVRLTRSGWLEERLPFIFISLPQWFQENYSQEFANLQVNSRKLTSPYDLYMTLQDVLVISGKNHTMEPSTSCPHCRSLFRAISTDRSCEEAGISQHWCTCRGYKYISPKNSMVIKAAHLILDGVEKIKNTKRDITKRCSKFSLKKIISSSISVSDSYKNNTYLLIIIETSPYATFEGTIQVVKDGDADVLTPTSDISRLDAYSDHSKCVSDSRMKLYCYCHR